MNKTLLLLRHAETEQLAHKDLERPLTEQGRHEAELVGRYLGENDLTPDTIVYSSARRARETVERMLPHFAAAPSLKESSQLYNAGPEEITGQLQTMPDELDTVALVGHSPGIPSLAIFLAADDSDIGLIDRVTASYPPAAVSVLRFDVAHWHEVAPALGRLESFISPDDL
ncbi:MAG: histidine phosphatase family protein [Alphaproteobacteria bacterium]|nr:histidine phosphatase family protein [Alphaproteobacteria bacterium]MCZ6763908.1 histidine phosphatase family protein [Alphaproteobacteria bacterium]